MEEVAWGIVANHGGGYSYRLCRVENLDVVDSISEECFQEIPLQFVGDTQWIQYGENVTNRTAIKAVRTSEGTFPPGSEWTRVPFLLVWILTIMVEAFSFPTPAVPMAPISLNLRLACTAMDPAIRLLVNQTSSGQLLTRCKSQRILFLDTTSFPLGGTVSRHLRYGILVLV